MASRQVTTGAPAETETVDVAREIDRIRTELEATIERLIGFLDRITPDPDLEPSLGYQSHHLLRPDLVDVEGCDSDQEGDPMEDLPGQLTVPEQGTAMAAPFFRLDGDDDDELTQMETGTSGQSYRSFTGETDDDENGHDAEAVNEDGGDIQDEPHDEDPPEDDLATPDDIINQIHAARVSDDWLVGSEAGGPLPPEKIKAARARFKAEPYRDPVGEVRRTVRARRHGAASLHANVSELVLDADNRPIGYRPFSG